MTFNPTRTQASSVSPAVFSILFVASNTDSFGSGMAFSSISSSGKPTYFENLISNKAVAAPYFGVHLARRQASGSQVSLSSILTHRVSLRPLVESADDVSIAALHRLLRFVQIHRLDQLGPCRLPKLLVGQYDWDVRKREQTECLEQFLDRGKCTSHTCTPHHLALSVVDLI